MKKLSELIREQLKYHYKQTIEGIKTQINRLFEGQDEDMEREIDFNEVGGSGIIHQYIDDQHNDTIGRVILKKNGVLSVLIDTGYDDYEMRADELTIEELLCILEQLEEVTVKDMNF